jgi:hypothetical protein
MEMTSHNTTLTPRRDGAAIKYLPIALAFAGLVTVGSVPAFAASTTHHHHRHVVAARSYNGLRMYAGESLGGETSGGNQMTESRAQAMHDCNMKAQPMSFSTWQTAQFATYGTCMTEHGQMP